MATYKGVVLFQDAFKAKKVSAESNPRFSLTMLFHPQDPEFVKLKAEYDAAVRDAFPSGVPLGKDVCLSLYDDKFRGKEYYDVRFTGYWVFSCNAKEEDRPTICDQSYTPVVDPGAESMVPGHIVWVNAGISGFTKGKGGMGGWLNGIMVTGQMGPHGLLSNKPSAESMFADINASPAGQAAAAAVPSPPVPPAPGVPAPPAGKVMTPAANGATYESHVAAGWSDVQMIEAGLLTAPGGVVPSFV